MKKIFSIGYEVPGKSEFLIDFSSKKSLMDADIVMFSPILPYYDRSSIDGGYYQGKMCLGEHGSFNFQEDIQHWEKELKNAISAGKTVFLILSKKEEFFIDTGKRNFSGTGRNRQTTINVTQTNNYTFLPINIGNITAATGQHIEFTVDNIFTDFFNKFKDYLEYQVYIDNVDNVDKVQVIFTGKDKTKYLGLVYRIGNGNLVVLPFIKYDEESFSFYDEKNKQSFWNDKGVKFGTGLIECFINIDRKLFESSEKTPLPDWAKQSIYITKKEQKITKDINQNLSKIKKIETVIDKLKKELEVEQLLKDLLFEHGKPLEIAVTKSLEILGYKAENYNDGELELDQVIISPEGHRFIGECEGKDSKDINITKFRQLLESLNADFAREEVEVKAYGILFGNPDRLKNPSERTLDFTQKCKIGAEREKIALIKTSDLFNITKYLKDNSDIEFQIACRKSIFEGLGQIVIFPTIPQK